GGGNTAIDCARTVLRLGAGEATIVYRRSRSEMPARADEVAAAEAEGVKIMFLALPARIVNEGNRVTGVECIRMELGEPDESGRRRPVPVKGSEFTIHADMVLPAIGEVPDASFISQADGLELTSWGSIKADDDMATNRKGVFAGGDCVSGPASIVEAIAAGNRAAGSIDRFLAGKPAGDGADSEIYRQLIMEKDRYVITSSRSRRVHPDETPVAERLNGMDEVEKAYTPAQADIEAERCLRCYRVVLTAF
ncbi:MAG: FAD-dependent oxidoreductase, partial [Dehalococcoidaceae bacterium]|nr:FAD-dependent oxidoreductase [Dehalococcoidaceae bacterium]